MRPNSVPEASAVLRRRFGPASLAPRTVLRLVAHKTHCDAARASNRQEVRSQASGDPILDMVCGQRDHAGPARNQHQLACSEGQHHHHASISPRVLPTSFSRCDAVRANRIELRSGFSCTAPCACTCRSNLHSGVRVHHPRRPRQPARLRRVAMVTRRGLRNSPPKHRNASRASPGVCRLLSNAEANALQAGGAAASDQQVQLVVDAPRRSPRREDNFGSSRPPRRTITTHHPASPWELLNRQGQPPAPGTPSRQAQPMDRSVPRRPCVPARQSSTAGLTLASNADSSRRH